jgi:O-antigen/teichoic acid export membrane protein
LIKKLNNKYLIFGGSIIISRGLEYFLLFFAALELSKSEYGQLEYYKKIVEVGSSVLAFGFPAMILSYTKSTNSKIYFYLLSIIVVLSLGSILMFLGFFDSIWLFIVPAMVFYALFFNGSIAQSYQIVKMGSNYASLYKIIISTLFYGIIFILIYFKCATGKAYLYPAIILIPLSILYAILEFNKVKVEFKKVKKYWNLFKKLLYHSFTLVISNFANLMFLYTDIFVIKILSSNANSEIAEFSFALNIASIILLVSTTLIQVDIEKLKQNSFYIKVLNKRIFLLTLGISALIVLGYYILIENWYLDYSNTFILFLIILLGKFFSNHANLYGTFLIIHKKFKLNLIVNIFYLILNIIFCFILYRYLGIIGLAISSSLMLILRSLTFLYHSNKKLKHESS